MRKAAFLICIVWLLISIPCLANNKVKIHLSINPEAKSFTCVYKIKVQSSETKSSFVFNLNNSFKVEEVSSKRLSNYRVKPFFDDFQRDSLKRIKVVFASRIKSEREITIRYSGNFPERYFTDKVIEFSAHTNWLPNIPGKEYEAVEYQLDVSIGDGYKVVSTNQPVGYKPGEYSFQGSAPNIEITAIAATHFEELTSYSGNHKISVLKASNRMSGSDTTLLSHADEIISYFNHTVGKEEPINAFTILLPGTNRDAFGLLDNAVNITYSDFNTSNLEDRLILAHEISHNWWAYGVWDDYNNWLNEAFATYSSLLYIRAMGDTATYQQEILKKEESSAGSPAIIGFDVRQYDYKTYRQVIYEKGTVALFQLHEKIGDKRFLQLLSKIAAAQVSTTEQLLDKIEQAESRELREWFASKLIN